MKIPVLVTGGCGYIGSHIVYDLRDAGYQPVVVDNLSNSRSDLLPENVPFYLIDINDTDVLKKILRDHEIKTVIHLAAFLSVEESVSQPLKYYQNNVGGTCSLLEACTANNVKKFIFSSTGATYSSSDQPIAETDPTDPSSPYGLSKLIAEKIIHDVAIANNIQAVALRYFNVAGADPQGRTGQQGINASHLIARACQAANGDAPNNSNEMKIFGTDYETSDGSCVRDYIHVSDLAEIHRVMIEKDFADPFIVFNCGYGSGYSVKEVVTRVRELTDKEFQITLADRRPGDLIQTVANNERLLTETNWRPKYNDLDLIIRTAWDWYQKEADRKTG